MRRGTGIGRAGAVLVVVTATTLAAVSPAPAQPRGDLPAFSVGGVATPTREVVSDLVTLSRNAHLQVVTVNDEGDRVPVAGVVASWVTKLVLAAVVAQELERRGVEITRAHRLLARRFDRHAYGAATWRSFPRRFQARQVERTAGAIALAENEGLDLTKSRRTRRAVVALITGLARGATVTVAPRFGTWDSQLAVVVPRQEGPPS
jgi:hypothetical protein